jgi:hypothetical protein
MVHLFIYLLLNANHEDGNWRGIVIKRGQILTGLNSLNKNTGITIRTLRTCLDRLQNTKEIDRQTTNKYSLITICNYESYQCNGLSSDKQSDKRVTSNRQATDKQPTTNNNNKEEKELKNENNIIPPPLNLIIEFCKERNSKIDPNYFFDYNEARGWKINGKQMKDWQATIRTWERYENNKRSDQRGIKSVNKLWDQKN